MSDMDTGYIPEVVQVVPGEAYTVYAYFDDGSIHLYDVAPLLKEGTVFAPMKDPKVFREALTVMNGTVAFDVEGNMNPYDCVDIAPEEIYRGRQVVDPLHETA